VFSNTEFLFSSHQAWELCCIGSLHPARYRAKAAVGRVVIKGALWIVHEDYFLSLNILHRCLIKNAIKMC
jgi:hypothetical protein